MLEMIDQELQSLKEKQEQIIDELKTYLGALGYDFDNSAIMFPFNIPDNNSDFATAFSSLFFDNINIV